MWNAAYNRFMNIANVEHEDISFDGGMLDVFFI